MKARSFPSIACLLTAIALSSTPDPATAGDSCDRLTARMIRVTGGVSGRARGVSRRVPRRGCRSHEPRLPGADADGVRGTGSGAGRSLFRPDRPGGERAGGYEGRQGRGPGPHPPSGRPPHGAGAGGTGGECGPAMRDERAGARRYPRPGRPGARPHALHAHPASSDDPSPSRRPFRRGSVGLDRAPCPNLLAHPPVPS